MVALIVERSSSRCASCNGNASPREYSHIHGGPKSMWVKGSSLDDENGCGVTYTSPIFPYANDLDEKKRLRDRLGLCKLKIMGE
jgi:hypothetical protein